MGCLRLALAAALAPALAAQTVITVLSSGSTATRYDMVILGDGYQASEQTRFDQDVNTFLAALFQTQPYQTFSTFFNVHTVFRASVDSGADHPDATPPIWRNTVYNASYNTGGTARCLYIGNTSQALADAALAPANEGRVLVLVNDSRYGGCAGTFAVSYNGSSMDQVQIHELGHSLGRLADEYDYPYNTYTGSEPTEVNITTSPVGQKWSHWIGTNGISAYEGAGYYLHGLWRPRVDCLMRSLGQALCNVCQEGIAKVTSSICNAITQITPPTANLTLLRGQVQPFAFAHFVPANHGPTLEWKVDGNLVAAQTASFALDTTGMALGAHTVECAVHDHTPIVRLDPQLLMRHANTWTVMVTDPSVAQLWIPGYQTSALWVTPGATITLTTTVRNDGPATAGPFDVEWFLSPPATSWSTGDVYLGKVVVPSLVANQQTTIHHVVTLPWRLEPIIHFVHCTVDRANTVTELVENDNSRYVGLIGQSGACETKLEYDDPLLYPFDAAAVSAGAGGAVHPTVVARCATSGTLYLLAWGCSGTTPGTTIAPGLQIPLNQDIYTQLGLAAINGPWFQAFLGTLDQDGLGRATFALPPAAGLWPSTGHFAALLVDPQVGFSAVTNPVAIAITP
jgi:hypothetical protein